MSSPILPQNAKIIPYDFGREVLDVLYASNTVWLTQRQIGELIGIDTSVVSRHISNLANEGDAVGIASYAIPTAGGIQSVNHYNLDVIIEVGFAARKSKLAKAFREWAKGVIKQHVVKQIRAVEQAQYSDVKDFIVQASDYDVNNPDCRNYFATIQNKLLYAASGMTAAEIIVKRADGLHPHMGLSAWQGESITKADAKVAKNYLTQDELQDLAALVIGLAAGAHMLMVKQSSTMRQWVTFVDQQIILYRCKLLMNKGLYSHEQAMKIVDREYQVFKGLLK